MKVLCFGSLNIDYTYKVDHFVEKGETIAATDLDIHVGGKGLNQSIALAKAGAQTYMAGAIGEDGIFLLKALQDAGVETSHIAVMGDVRSGNAIIQKNFEGDNCILLYGGANRAITREHVDEVFEHFEHGDFLLLQNEINDMPYIIEKAKACGMKIALNPSPLDDAVLKLPLDLVDIFLVNEVEASQLLNRKVGEIPDGLMMIEKLSKKFPNASIVLTLGERGSIYRDKEELVQQAAYMVPVVDTTGAGDTYTGYFLGGLLNGCSAHKSMEMAAKAAALSVTLEGAAESIPALCEVLNW